jgi:hypothetical protein
MRKQLLIAGILFVVTAAACLLGQAFIYSRPGVTRHNFRRLYWEMPETEAEAILGGPGEPKHYTTSGLVKEWRSDPEGSRRIRLTVWDGKVKLGSSYSDGDETLEMEWDKSPPSKATIIRCWFVP